MRQAVISFLLLKKIRIHWNVALTSPIQLDSKVLAKMMARRLEVVLPSFIPDDQTGLRIGSYF